MNVLDVMSIQKRLEAAKVQQSKPTDYNKGTNNVFLISRFLFECAIKLRMKPLTAATAAMIFHRFRQEIDVEDEYLIATAALYLAGKIKTEAVNLRDVMNVMYVTLNRGATPLDLNEEYWAIRDTILQAELLIVRTLKFDLDFDHPHKYLLYIMKSVQDSLGASTWSTLPIGKLAASLLQDFHHSPKILSHKPIFIAVGCLSLALQAYGIFMPPANDQEGNFWYSNLVSDLPKEKHWEIIEDIIDVYKQEAAIDANNT